MTCFWWFQSKNLGFGILYIKNQIISIGYRIVVSLEFAFRGDLAFSSTVIVLLFLHKFRENDDVLTFNAAFDVFFVIGIKGYVANGGATLCGEASAFDI